MLLVGISYFLLNWRWKSEKSRRDFSEIFTWRSGYLDVISHQIHKCAKYTCHKNSWYKYFSYYSLRTCTAQKMKFSIKDFFNKCDQIRSFLRIWSHSLKKSLMETSFFVQWCQTFSRLESMAGSWFNLE